MPKSTGKPKLCYVMVSDRYYRVRKLTSSTGKWFFFSIVASTNVLNIELIIYKFE